MYQSVLLMAPQAQGGNPIMSFLPIVLIMVVFYFFMIRPQMKRQKEVKNFRETLKKGDTVATVGGIYGKITDVETNGTTVTLEIANNVTVKVDKSALIKDFSQGAVA